MDKRIVFYKRDFQEFRSKCNQGHNHPSIFEAQYCNELQRQIDIGEIESFIYEAKFRLVVNDVYICSHKPDFLVIKQTGQQEVHEVKGAEFETWLIRKRLFQALYPMIPYYTIKTK